MSDRDLALVIMTIGSALVVASAFAADALKAAMPQLAQVRTAGQRFWTAWVGRVLLCVGLLAVLDAANRLWTLLRPH